MRKDVIERLLELASGRRDDEVAVAAIYAIGEGAPSSAKVVDALMDLTKENSNDVSAAAAKALGRVFRRK